jgi:hypothetical protein
MSRYFWWFPKSPLGDADEKAYCAREPIPSQVAAHAPHEKDSNAQVSNVLEEMDATVPDTGPDRQPEEKERVDELLPGCIP